jgi:hypothetical protein
MHADVDQGNKETLNALIAGSRQTVSFLRKGKRRFI